MKELSLFLSSGSGFTAGNLVFTSPNKFEYKIPQEFKALQDSEIGISSLSLPNSFRNITSALLNNSFSIIFNGVTTVITIPDGSYSYEDINGYLETELSRLGYYLLNPSGEKVYFIRVDANPVLYTVTWTFTKIPTALTGDYLNYTNPQAITLSGTSPQVILPNTNVLKLFGITTANTYPSTNLTTQYLNSDTTPILSNYSSIILCMEGVSSSSSFSTRPDALYSFFPNNTSGNIMSYHPTHIDFVPLSSGVYTRFSFTIISQSDNRPIEITDPTQFLINLRIRTK